MGKGRNRRGRQRPSQPGMPHKPAGPGKTFVEEGEGDEFHYRNVGDHPLDLAYEKAMFGPVQKRRGGEHAALPPHPFLQGGTDDTSRFDRLGRAERLYEAGTHYRGLCDGLARSGLDSTQMIDRSRSGDTPVPFTQTQVNAVHALEKIDAHLSPIDWRIVRRFCGEGYSAAEAVMGATGCHPSNVRYRLCEALESLSQAISTARRKKAA